MFSQGKEVMKLREEVAKLAGDVGGIREDLGQRKVDIFFKAATWGPDPPGSWKFQTNIPTRPTTALGRIERIEAQIDRILNYLGVQEVQTKAVPSKTIITKIPKSKPTNKSNKREK